MKRLAAAPPPTEVLASRIDAIVRFDRARLGEIRCPTLVVVAADDMLTSRFYSEGWRRIGAARGPEHWRPLAPNLVPDEFNAVVGAFLRAHRRS
jgi:pimeloyl-ACP methyl ester carboxylesterase